MNEDIEALMTMMNQLERLGEIADKQNDDSEKVFAMVELGKELSDLKHENEKLKNENAFLRMLLKEQLGCNT